MFAKPNSIQPHQQQPLCVFERPFQTDRIISVQAALKDAPFCMQSFPPQGCPRSAAEAYTEEVPKFRQLPCRTFISVGTCPYRERCVYLHDPRLMSRDAKTKTRKKNKEDIVQDSLFWPVLPYQEVGQRLDSSRLPHVIQRYGVPTPHEDQYKRHDQAVYSMWMHFVTFCSLEVIINPYENEADMSTYLHPGFQKSPRDRKGVGMGTDKPRLGGLFLDDTQGVNPFINVPRLPVFKIMSGGESVTMNKRSLSIQNAPLLGQVNESSSIINPGHINQGHTECVGPTTSRAQHQGAIYNQSTFNATALSPSPHPGSAKIQQLRHSPDHHLHVHLPNPHQHDFPSHHTQQQQMCMPQAPTRLSSHNNSHLFESERIMHVIQERERVREIERNLEREREKERQHSWIAATSLHSQYRTEDASQRLSPLHGGKHSGTARQPDRPAGTGTGAVRPFSCFGANGLYSAHHASATNDTSSLVSSVTPRSNESLGDYYSSSPHSVSANLSPAPSPVWSGVRAQHACGDRPLRRRERDLSEMCERQQVQQFNEMVQVRHSHGGVTTSNGSSNSVFRAREGAQRTTVHPQARSASSISPCSSHSNELDQMEVSYMDDEMHRASPQLQRQHQSDANLGLVSRSSSYLSRDDNSEATLVLTRRVLRVLS